MQTPQYIQLLCQCHVTLNTSEQRIITDLTEKKLKGT